jgi:hypothetical protein
MSSFTTTFESLLETSSPKEGEGLKTASRVTIHEERNRKKLWDQHDVAGPLARAMADLADNPTPSEKKKWKYACSLLGTSSLKEGEMRHDTLKLD